MLTRLPPLVACALALTAFAPAARAEALPKHKKPKVEIVFALDTTGSMGGLIEGAKQKIWFIANEAMKAEQRPEVRIGLVAYRDKGDEYVTRALPLTSDLDKVYETLMSYRAAGGGDGPEHVNAALHEAVNNMDWSSGKGVLRLVFLVGDAPPHMDYQDDVKHQKTSRAAVGRHIYINTIQCGRMDSATPVFKEIAHNSEGRYAAIAQNGGVVAVKTPYDDELRRLGRELDSTRLVYGSRRAKAERKAAYGRVAGLAASAPSSAAADRAVVKSKNVASRKEDLVTLAEESSIGGALASIDEAELPDELQGKDQAERRQALEKMSAERRALQEKIASVSKERDEWLAEQTARRAKADKKEGFDAEVVDMIHSEAKRAGLTY